MEYVSSGKIAPFFCKLLLVFPPYGMILRYNGVFRYYKLNSSTPIAVHAGTKYEFYRVWALIYNT